MSELRPRVIVTTDGEGDDQDSMMRFLLYVHQWNVAGLIHSSSKHHWAGDPTHPAKNWHSPAWLDRQIDAYEQVRPRLIEHADFPPAAELRKVVRVGNIAYEGEMDAPTPGSELIVDVLLDEDPRPVWLQAWGGTNTIARALLDIKTRHPGRVDDVLAKARVFMIEVQDPTLKGYLQEEWPGLFVILSKAYGAIAYQWRELQTPQQQEYFSADWMRDNITTGHGLLCGMYKLAKDGAFRSEGDSPAFMHTIDVGLRTLEHPRFGGWGGRFDWTGQLWRSADDEGDLHRSILRYTEAFQNDWAARADWCVKAWDDANHPPTVRLDSPLDIQARRGQRVDIDAGLSSDPDGESLAFAWWVYVDAGTYPKPVEMTQSRGPCTSLTMPGDASPGQTIHLICEVTDSGLPPLTRYARVIITCTE
jgi:hypothetical protein